MNSYSGYLSIKTGAALKGTNMIKFSLLKKTEEEEMRTDVLYDLSIDRAVNSICSDMQKASYFLDILSRPLRCAENIRYRQDILRDFLDIDGLYDDFRLLCSRYDKIRSDWSAMKLGGASASDISASPEALLSHTYSSLKITSMFPETLASFFRSMRDMLNKYDIKSEGLCAIRSHCENMIENESLEELVSIAEIFRYGDPDELSFTVSEKLGNDMRLAECELCEVGKLSAEPKSGIFRIFSQGRGKGGSEVELKNEDEAQSDALYALNHALARLDSSLSSVTNAIYEAFFGLSREMLFYSAAIDIYNFLCANGINCCIPEVLEARENIIDVRGAKDILLAAEGMSGDEIVPNDIFLDAFSGGILVRGSTDTGKTVFLRSVGMIQMLAQGGIAVPAESARISVREGIFTHFSSAEEEFLKGDAAGRFDAEAREISAILDSVVPGSLVLLNETFQSTSYAEGTSGIYNILRAFERLNTKFIFVTHLTKIYDMYTDGSVTLCETSEKEKYKIVSVK